MTDTERKQRSVVGWMHEYTLETLERGTSFLTVWMPISPTQKVDRTIRVRITEEPEPEPRYYIKNMARWNIRDRRNPYHQYEDVLVVGYFDVTEALAEAARLNKLHEENQS